MIQLLILAFAYIWLYHVFGFEIIVIVLLVQIFQQVTEERK